MQKEIELIDKMKLVSQLENFTLSYKEQEREQFKDIIEGVDYAIAVIACTKPAAIIYKESEDKE